VGNQKEKWWRPIQGCFSKFGFIEYPVTRVFLIILMIRESHIHHSMCGGGRNRNLKKRAWIEDWSDTCPGAATL
jgi:hypothetical protein